VATQDMKERLSEIREQYWSLKKFPDGIGGIIYQREGKGWQVGENPHTRPHGDTFCGVALLSPPHSQAQTCDLLLCATDS
jgi:hypothetical protein